MKHSGTLKTAPCANCHRERPVAALGACHRCYSYRRTHHEWPPAALLRNADSMVEAKTMLPKDLLDLVDSLSRAGGVSRSTFLRKMIEAEVDRRTVPESPPA